MKKIFHIGLSFLLLVSTAGLSVSRHICGDEVKDVAIMHQATNCHGEMPMEDEGCCDDETEVFQVDDDFQLEKSMKLDMDSQLLFVMAHVIINQIFESQNIVHYSYYDGSPPISGYDILKKIQSFLL